MLSKGIFYCSAVVSSSYHFLRRASAGLVVLDKEKGKCYTETGTLNFKISNAAVLYALMCLYM